MTEHAPCVSGLHGATTLEVDDLIRDRLRKVHVVRDDNQRAFEFVEQAQERCHFACEARIEGRGRLVEQHDVGLHGEGARNGHALLLASGEASRVLVLFSRKANEIQEQHADLFRL